MNRRTMIFSTLALVAVPVAAFAGNGAKTIHCPPGLAKKNPPCVPPGQAKKRWRYRVGDHINDDFDLVRRPWRYGLDSRHTYYRLDDHFVRVNKETGEILELLDALGKVLD